jgi:Tol biopolymer transport system component
MQTQHWSWVLVFGFLGAPARAQTTTCVSLGSAGLPAGGSEPSISAEGRFVAFTGADNIVPGDNNGFADVFVRDRLAGTTELVSVGPGGVLGDNHSAHPHITPDGRYVVFLTYATNLVPGITTPHGCVVVRDRWNGTTEIASVSSTGAPGEGPNCLPWISADGRFVAFDSPTGNLVPGDTNGDVDVFVRDRLLGTTERVSVSTSGAQVNAECWVASITDDGRYVLFSSESAILASGDNNGTGVDAFIRDRQTSTTVRVSSNAAGVGGDQTSWAHMITPDGRYVVFDSSATNLVPGDNNGVADIFVRDLQLGTIELVSLDSAGVQGNGDSHWGASISADGRFVVFGSLASNLVPGDTNGFADMFLRDRLNGTTERLSVSTEGAQSNQFSSGAWLPPITPDGRFVAFHSYASNLVPGDTDAAVDVFVRDLHASGFASLCEPGGSGVIACPCGNPPSGAGRGCDNLSATGGASLAASGIAYLSSDSLAFTTSGENPTAASVLVQGAFPISAGVRFGRGVRCVGGTLRRLYVKSALNGSIRAPGGGDLVVTERSAQLGDTLQPGATRYYLVYYRDPIVFGGCPATSTFNSTQTASISWWP